MLPLIKTMFALSIFVYLNLYKAEPTNAMCYVHMQPKLFCGCP